MLGHILKYNELGWATFPVLSAGPKAKEPAVEGWKSRVADPLAAAMEEPAYLKAGAYGVVLRPQDLVIDLDPRNFKGNTNPWKALRTDLGLGKPAAPAVLTGSGGAHFYFLKPPELRLVGKLKDYPGMDFKSGAPDKGAYVIGPGSKHPSGGVYRLVEGTALSEIGMAPPALLEALTRQETALNEGTGALTGGPQELARYISWLESAAEPAIEGKNGDDTTFKTAVKGRDFGLTEVETYTAMFKYYNSRCLPPWSSQALKTKVSNAYKYAIGAPGVEDPVTVFESLPENAVSWDEEEDQLRKYDLDQHNQPRKTLKNAINYLYISPELRERAKFNQFTGDIELVGELPWSSKRGPGNIWSDTDIILLKYHLAKTKKIEFSVEMLWEALRATSMRFAYHPVRQYIKSTPWDEQPRIDTWLCKYCGAADNAYTAAVGRKLLAGLVARVFTPGVKFDYCTVLEGGQGIGKSTVCNILGGEWYGDIILDPHSRDTIDMMRGKWVIELSEMEVTRRSDAQALKAFVSRTSDRARLAYARAALDFPRQCVFIGTINPDGMGYLSDNTGNRRFWPIRCGDKIDMSGLEKVRDQLFAEAYIAYKKREVLYLTGDILKYAEIEQSERMSLDPWKDAVMSWMDGPGAEVNELTVAQVWELVLGGAIKSISRGDQTRIGRILTDLGWPKYRPLRGGSQTKVYVRPSKKALDK